MAEDVPPFDELVESMKKAAKALQDAGVPFALAGGLAAWPRGAPESDHDVDFYVKPEDAERAQKALVEAGMKPENPPEDWLLKVYDGEAMIDLIFDPNGGPVTDEWFDRASEIEVNAMRMPVASLEDVMVSKLLALDEQDPDFKSVLEIARSVREQIDWERVRMRTADSAWAKAFFTLAEELGVVDRE